MASRARITNGAEPFFDIGQACRDRGLPWDDEQVDAEGRRVSSAVWIQQATSRMPYQTGIVARLHHEAPVVMGMVEIIMEKLLP